MIVGVEGGIVTAIFSWANEMEEISGIPRGMTLIDAPDYVGPGWTVENGRFIPERIQYCAYDFETHTYIRHDEYRRILHSRTDADVLEATRKIREGDSSLDWELWLSKLDEYNKAVSDTKNQETYPDFVTYPEYPSKPSKE